MIDMYQKKYWAFNVFPDDYHFFYHKGTKLFIDNTRANRLYADTISSIPSKLWTLIFDYFKANY